MGRELGGRGAEAAPVPQLPRPGVQLDQVPHHVRRRPVPAAAALCRLFVANFIGLVLGGGGGGGGRPDVSKQNFASEYALESARRDLHSALLCTALNSHFFKKIARILPKFAKIFRN